MFYIYRIRYHTSFDTLQSSWFYLKFQINFFATATLSRQLLLIYRQRWFARAGQVHGELFDNIFVMATVGKQGHLVLGRCAGFSTSTFLLALPPIHEPITIFAAISMSKSTICTGITPVSIARCRRCQTITTKAFTGVKGHSC